MKSIVCAKHSVLTYAPFGKNKQSPAKDGENPVGENPDPRDDLIRHIMAIVTVQGLSR